MRDFQVKTACLLNYVRQIHDVIGSDIKDIDCDAVIFCFGNEVERGGKGIPALEEIV